MSISIINRILGLSRFYGKPIHISVNLGHVFVAFDGFKTDTVYIMEVTE